MTVSRGAMVTYGVATSEGNVPVIRIRLRAGERISDREWPEIRQTIIGSIDRVTAIIRSESDTYTYIAIQLSTTPGRYHAAVLEADCRTICHAANIQIVRGPEPMPA